MGRPAQKGTPFVHFEASTFVVDVVDVPAFKYQSLESVALEQAFTVRPLTPCPYHIASFLYAYP